ncbi:Hydroxymethylpyrimidine ABC transporter, ATPase component [Salinispira pacifica]|uniref:Hydroxymethylpyrimidine ABC transporter, ATPase component n=2 Tax=Salinispira pacifica TaxID=1307761 RepID=V5WL50_9SPIO|nr:Hydroxymethylpyrimidine ABC transporter, ATPase component [Salinispira pacifica]
MYQIAVRMAEYSAGLILFFLLWWGGSVLAGPGVLPGPGRVLDLIASPGLIADFLVELSRTLSRALLGFAAAWIISIPLGLLIGGSGFSRRVAFFPVFLLQGAPPLLWITPLVLWLGTKGAAAPAVAFLVTTPLLLSHIVEARRQIRDYEYQLFRIYNNRPRTLWTELYIPRLLPALKTNAHLGMMTAVKSAMVAEWFAAQDGFGRRINSFYQFFEVDRFFAWALLFLLSMAVLSLCIRLILRYSFPERTSTAAPMQQTGTFQPVQSDEAAAMAVQTGTQLGIQVRQLRVSFGRHKIFSGMNFSVSPERPLVIHGPSGCGKTTLLKTIGGLYTPDEGTVQRPHELAMLFQDDLLLEHRDALGNTLLPVLPSPSAENINRAAHMLDLWGLEGFYHHFPSQLSGGMRKRLSMARAWYLRPRALLMDEPFNNLDKSARDDIWDRFFLLHSRRPVPTIIITHYPEELAGRAVDSCSWSELLRP